MKCIAIFPNQGANTDTEERMAGEAAWATTDKTDHKYTS